MPVSFNGKIYNAEVFLPYYNRIPRTKTDALKNSGVLEIHNELRNALVNQTGGNYFTQHFKGRPDADSVLNYDGETDFSASTITSFEQALIIKGRAGEFFEDDFTYEISHTNFFDYVGEVLANFQDDVDEADLLAELKGIETVLPSNHIYETKAVVGASDVNTATQLACGDNKEGFALFVCHSTVARQLENLAVLEYWKYTDEKGITRPTNLASINGKTCIIDDQCPYDPETGTYTSYILGRGAFIFADVGVKVPIEVGRDPEKHGGQDFIINRWREVLGPKGISYTKKVQAKLSPTAEELANPENWELAKGENGDVYPDKAIHIAILKTLDKDTDATTDEGIEKTSVKTTSAKTTKETAD